MIRNYTPSDKQQLVKLFLLNTPAFFCPPEQKDLEQFLDEQEVDEYYVMEEDGKILACGGHAIENDEGWLCWYMVHPDYHGKGFGTQIAIKSLSILKSTPGLSKVIVRTSQLVFPFYEKLGFRLISTQNDYWGAGMHLYLMEMDL